MSYASCQRFSLIAFSDSVSMSPTFMRWALAGRTADRESVPTHAAVMRAFRFIRAGFGFCQWMMCGAASLIGPKEGTIQAIEIFGKFLTAFGK